MNINNCARASARLLWAWPTLKFFRRPWDRQEIW